MAEMTHSCGWTYGPGDKHCRGCGERLMKLSREYSEIKAEMDVIQNSAKEMVNPALTAIAMTMFNILAWAAGESQVRPTSFLQEMEKMAGKMPPNFGSSSEGK